MTYHYIGSEPGLWTVGSGTKGVDWEPESDHGSVREAAARTAYLNGGPDPDAEPVDDGLHALVAQLAELTAVLRPVAERFAAETSPAGRDQGAPSVEPGEAVSPAVATTGQPGDQPVDERAEQIAGLRELVDWLEAHPAVPIQSTLRRYALYPEHWVDKGDTAAALSELRRISDAVGIELTSMSRHVYLSVPPFRGGVEVELVVCDAAHLLHGEEPAAGGSAEPTDIPRGGEEVAGPVEGAGSATSPEWSPGAGLERVKRELPGIVPELTDDDMRKADEIIAAARPVVVLVASPIPGGPPARAEVCEDKGVGTTVKVIYCDSRTGARVARRRILGPAPDVESEG